MKFTKIRLNGFKSFVDPSELFISDGLTGIVGPNGCGKSNLLEAIRWVMGENRPTAMRGGGMEDVIFAGAMTRPSRNFAEVALMIDNTERLAPAAFNDSDNLEIIRRITRDIGSAYKVNGKDVRARDVQMLFADASTGAHSPALVRQGQISELINSKPKARRRILEEAAGISGLYQRRHEAELKLNSTEQNLARVDDVVEQLAGQLAQLARQARQAARYRDINDNLQKAEAALLYLRWKDAERARTEAMRALQGCTVAASQAESASRQAALQRQISEDALPALREEDTVAAAIVQRLHIRRDALNEAEQRAIAAIQALQSRIEQMAKDSDREAGLNADATDTIAQLEWEKAEIIKAGEGHDERLAQAHDAASDAARALQDYESALDRQTEDAARLFARHQSVQRMIEDAQSALTKEQSALATATATQAETETQLTTATDALHAAQAEEEDAIAMAEQAEVAFDAAETARADAQTRENEARALLSSAEGEANALEAEFNALAKIVKQNDADHTQVSDLLTVELGYEKALGAALSDDLKAPITTDSLGSGWVTLPDYDSGVTWPDGVTPLINVVTVPDALKRRIAMIGVTDAQTATALHADLQPGQRIVSTQGDLWRWDGYRMAAADAPSAAALRLQQMNRLAALRDQLDNARTQAEAARAHHERLKHDLERRAQAESDARNLLKNTDQKVTDMTRALNKLRADVSVLDSKRDIAGQTVTRCEDRISEAQDALSNARLTAEDLPDPNDTRDAIEVAKTQVEGARIAMMTKRAAHDEIRREGDARQRRLQEIAKETSGWQHRLDTAAKRISELNARKAAAGDELSNAMQQPQDIAEQREDLHDLIEDAQARCKAAADALAEGEAALSEHRKAEKDAEKAASDARELRARADARNEAALAAADTALERIAEALNAEPTALPERFGFDPAQMADITSLENNVNALKRQREAIGAVNLRAEEDAREIQQEHDTLVNEKADLENAVKTLRQGIFNLNREGRERLLKAFETVNESFSRLFVHLFGGGEAKLVMVESDDPLDAGLEIMCQPPGKKLSTLSLLSGGEQTLTALALIFAVFLANPAPICVLDEVDAPLDDANVTRFCDLLDEMSRRTKTKLLVITHHAVTMARMDRLFGVTMQEQGVSQLVSVDLKRAEALVS